MIARLQKTRVLETIVQARMRFGRFPYLRDVLPMVVDFLRGKRLGGPLANLRPVVFGQPIGGPRGTDIADTFKELRQDLDLLYTAIIDLASRSIDLYDIFASRRDRLAAKISQITTDIQTLLAQQSAGSRASVTETFHTLDDLDLTQSTVVVDLSEGVASLPPDSSSSVKYDGSKIKVVKTLLPVGGSEPGPPFQTVFSPFRLDAWYATLPVGSVYEAQINVTGADYFKGGTEEVQVNAVRIQPTGPIHVDVDWSPDGLNWRPLSPAASITTTESYTFHFAPVQLGFLRFRIKHSEQISAAARGQNQTRPVGIKRIEILQRGFSSSASLYSNEYHFSETINTVVAEIEADIPAGTRIDFSVSLTPGGPWSPVQGGPVTFDTRLWQDLTVSFVQEEQPGVPQTMWRFPVPDSQPPLPNTGDLVAGRGQVSISAYPFDWSLKGDPYHIPEVTDWTTPLGAIRSRVFTPLGILSGLSSSDFVTNHNPLAVDNTSDSYTVVTIRDADGNFILQPGYSYRLRTYVWADAPTTLQNQQVGVVNTAGIANTKVAPVAVYVNGSKVYQNQVAATSVSSLNTSAYKFSMSLQQGFNEVQVLIQVPLVLASGVTGVAGSNIFLYIQPNVFSSNLQDDLGISYIQAYKDPWPRVSEFNLRYNTAPGVREVWAWDENLAYPGTTLDGGKLQYVLFNHDPTNTAPSTGTTTPQSFQTIDGVNYGAPTNMVVRYPSDRNLDAPATSLFFRAELFKDPGASSPPILRSYRLIVN